MRDKLLMLSLGIAVVGLVALYFAAQGYAPPLYSIAELNEDFYGKQVAVAGIVTSVSTSKDGHVFFTLSDDAGSIQAVAFKSSGLSAPVKGSTVRLRGEYAKYQDKPEIIVKRIEMVSAP